MRFKYMSKTILTNFTNFDKFVQFIKIQGVSKKKNTRGNVIKPNLIRKRRNTWNYNTVGIHKRCLKWPPSTLRLALDRFIIFWKTFRNVHTSMDWTTVVIVAFKSSIEVGFLTKTRSFMQPHKKNSVCSGTHDKSETSDLAG